MYAVSATAVSKVWTVSRLLEEIVHRWDLKLAGDLIVSGEPGGITSNS